MKFLTLAKNQYTTKIYRNEKISADKIAELQQILRLSPSSINSQPWQFVFVSDEKIKNQLAEVSMMNRERIMQCSHLIVFTVIDEIADFEKQIESSLPEGAVNYYKQFVKMKSETEIKSWLKCQVYLSLGFFLSACFSMGIDSTPMEGILPKEYDRILGIEKGYKTLFAVAIGYRDEKDENQPTKKTKQRLPLYKIIKFV
ncbi:nitroreductase family protein [Capnocytophaga felis]|uniref:Oxygen-insensitive NAD(P)H-dependent nitroreductase NfsB n=1 Tax=Capnocytophaga felis TaxID=2267611 RepID=A0A5M4BBR5_9FLAO|nr:nitroreductase family protein [Capnocytophaga felis]GET46516.1 oxygen-insensitive NAD(P)H-dependent nitroreductase NfsB [Capnocytophaga felis]GET48406.1 oxygen-insensitive NAD(P)H-dependent nitroreductase NfsB [Capnocytophaga felis]